MIVGLGAAAELVARNLGADADNMRKCRDLLYSQLKANLDVILISEEPMLPNTLLLAFNHEIRGAEVINRLEGAVLASTGAACHSLLSASAVLSASGIPL